LGFDCYYQNDLDDHQIAGIAASQARAVLTRDIGLLKHKRILRGYWLRSQRTEEQLEEVLKRFALRNHLHPFSRCIACNGVIRRVDVESVRTQIPQRVLEFQEEFFQCDQCRKVYWKGTHYERMREFVKRFSP
jgi:uncharacterized protein with PIN domain